MNMNKPRLEPLSPSGSRFFQLDHRAVNETDGVGCSPIVGGDAVDQFAGNLNFIHGTMADTAEELGFRIARGDSRELFRDLSRSVAHNEAIKAAKARAEIAVPGTAADAALQSAAGLADAYGRVVNGTRRRVLAPFARELVRRLRDDRGIVGTAQAIADSARDYRDPTGRKLPKKLLTRLLDVATMADADLNMAGGLVENLTSYLFMAFTEPQRPQHFRDMFRIQSGINIGLDRLQVLFYRIRGEAKIWDGTSGDYGNSGPGVAQMFLPVMNFRSSDNLDIITAARELLVFGAANMRLRQLNFAHEVMHNRLSYGLQVPAPGQVPGLSLKNYTGTTIKNTGLSLVGISPSALYDVFVAAVMDPKQISGQAFDPSINGVLGITVGIEKAAQQIMVVSGTPIGQSVMSFFRQNFPGVEVRVQWELENLFADGYDAVVCWPKDGDAAPVYLCNPSIMLPQFTYGFGVRSDVYSTSAGMVWGATVGAEVQLIANGS